MHYQSLLSVVIVIMPAGLLNTWAGEGVDGVDEALPRHALARMGSYRHFHGPHIRNAAISPDGRIIASTSDEVWWYDGETRTYASDNIVVLWDSGTGKRLRELQVPHAPVFSVIFSPDSKRLAVSFGREVKDSGIVVVEIESGKVVRKFSDGRLGLVRYAMAGKSLLLTEDYRDKLALWNIESGKRTRSWERPDNKSKWLKQREYVSHGVLSPNGKFLAWLGDVAPDYSKLPSGVFPPPHVPNPTVLIVVDAESGELLHRKEFPRDCLNRFTFFADGQRFMTGGKKLTAYETATGKELFSLSADSTYHFALSPDGRSAVAMTGASQVSLWDLEKKQPTHELLKGMIPASLGNFSADGKSVLLVTLRTLRVFDTASGKERISLGHRSRVTPRFSDDGRTLITTCDEVRRTWDVSSKKAPKLLREESRNTWEGICGNQVVAHSKDGRYFVAGRGIRQLKLRETASGKDVRDLDGFPYPIFGMFSYDSSRLLTWHGAIGEEFDGFRLYNVATGKKTGQMTTPNRAGYYPAISGDGRFITWADRSGIVHVHEGATGNFVRKLHPKGLAKSECNDADILFARDGSHLIVTTYNHDLFRKPDGDKWLTLPTRVFRVADAEVSRFYTNPKTTNRAMPFACSAVSVNGRLLAVAEKDSPAIRVIDLAGGKIVAELNGHREGVHGLAFSPDDQTLASGGEDALVFLWDVPGLK